MMMVLTQRKSVRYMGGKVMSEVEKGTLYLVPTPIGNLQDITYRAVDILKNADIIAAEDTRHTRILLEHLGIQGHPVSYHEHNKKEAGPKLIEALKEGHSVAQVSDAGMPVISDPGADLVCLALDEGIPGNPSSVHAAGRQARRRIEDARHALAEVRVATSVVRRTPAARLLVELLLEQRRQHRCRRSIGLELP